MMVVVLKAKISPIGAVVPRGMHIAEQ